MKDKVQESIDNYVSSRKGKSKLDDSVIGFIKKNRIVGKTPKEMDALISSATKLHNGTLLGEGDKFKKWCLDCGRKVPDDELVSFMNRDPFEAAQYVKKSIPNDLSIWRSWCSYRAGKGRKNV